MDTTAPRFNAKSLAFLRALKRNNDREWFKARKDRYDTVLRAPMLEVIERLAEDFRSFAPDQIASPRLSMYRIYRDTRFSDNKTPLKTHIAAVFPRRGLPKHQAAGFYFEVAPQWVWIGGGLWAPEPPQLLRVREHIATNVKRFRAIVEAPAFRRHVGPLSGDQLQRVPRGFHRDHVAASYLKHRQFLASRELPAEFAIGPGFYAGLLDTFRRIAPLVTFLNEPLLPDA